MAFDPVNRITSRLVALPGENIDTDRIIPARFLKSVESEGFGEKLFFDWRYREDGTPDPGFVLNRPEGQGQILLTGRNFGCGSSREHAAWALYQYGFRVIISSGFADIFRNNALNTGFLPIELTQAELTDIFSYHDHHPETEWMIDLPTQTLSPSTPFSFLLPPFSFSVNSFRKQCLLSGLDQIDYLIGLKTEIIGFENNNRNHLAI